MSLETKYISKDGRGSDILEHIALAIDSIRFGSVEIVIHDGRVVQIERKEKLRLDTIRSAVTTKS